MATSLLAKTVPAGNPRHQNPKTWRKTRGPRLALRNAPVVRCPNSVLTAARCRPRRNSCTLSVAAIAKVAHQAAIDPTSLNEITAFLDRIGRTPRHDRHGRGRVFRRTVD